MIGVVVVSHGRLAHELLSAAEHVVGQMDQAEGKVQKGVGDLKEGARDALKN